MVKFVISMAVGVSVMLCVQAMSDAMTRSWWDVLLGIAAALLVAVEMEKLERG